MPKQIINTVGLLIVLGIIAAGVALVAGPIWVQSLAVTGQAQIVAAQNDTQQAAVDALAEQDADDVDAALVEVEAQIPGEPRMDTASALITDAATATGATVLSFSPGEAVPFTNGAPADTKQPASTDDGAAEDGANPGNTQIPVSMTVSAPDLSTMLAFLDELRAGPRLLGSIQATVSTRDGSARADIAALAFAYTTGGQQ